MFDALYKSDGVYVMRFRKELKAFAKYLRWDGFRFASACFDREHACAEIRTWLGLGRLVAVVRVAGGEGAPAKMEITSSEWIPPSAILRLQKDLPALRVSFSGVSNEPALPARTGLYG